MSVTIKLSTTLRDHITGYNPQTGLVAEASGQSVKDLALSIGLPLEEIHVVMVNGQQGSLEQVLSDNDRVAYFPAVGGG